MTNNFRPAMTRDILRIDGHYYVQRCSIGDGEYRDDGRILMYHLSADESETPEIDSPDDARKMERAIFDAVQCWEDVKDGDVFVTTHGVFVVDSCWSVSRRYETANEAKTRRARLRRLEKVAAARRLAEYEARRAALCLNR